MLTGLVCVQLPLHFHGCTYMGSEATSTLVLEMAAKLPLYWIPSSLCTVLARVRVKFVLFNRSFSHIKKFAWQILFCYLQTHNHNSKHLGSILLDIIRTLL